MSGEAFGLDFSCAAATGLPAEGSDLPTWRDALVAMLLTRHHPLCERPGRLDANVVPDGRPI